MNCSITFRGKGGIYLPQSLLKLSHVSKAQQKYVHVIKPTTNFQHYQFANSDMESRNNFVYLHYVPLKFQCCFPVLYSTGQ